MNRRPGRAALALVSATALWSVVATGCAWFPGGDDDASTSTTRPQVMQVPVSVSGFCEQMLSIRNDALNPDATFDDGELLQRYEAAFEVAPPAIAADLQTLIEEVRSGSATEETSAVEGDADLDLPGEMWTPDDTASGRVFDYVDTACAGTSSNPGPAATVPE